MMSRDDVLALTPWQMVLAYLGGGWLYEYRAASIMLDDAWDALCRRIDAEWETLPDHPHSRLIDRSALASATAQYLTDRYVPLITRHWAVRTHGGGVDPGVSYIVPPIRQDQSIADYLSATQ